MFFLLLYSLRLHDIIVIIAFSEKGKGSLVTHYKRSNVGGGFEISCQLQSLGNPNSPVYVFLTSSALHLLIAGILESMVLPSRRMDDTRP